MTDLRDGGSVLIVGVGGQGVVLASAVVADAALRTGYDVKQSEVHGMSQRGGIVTSHLRFGPKVHSPLIEVGQADAVVAFEWNEALRWLPHLRPGAPLIANLQRLVPPGACRDRLGGSSDYPALALDVVGQLAPDLRVCDAASIAGAAGSPKAVNSVLLGVLEPLLPFPEEAWYEALRAHVPRGTWDVNQRAFEAGRALRFPDHTRQLAASRQSRPDVVVGPGDGKRPLQTPSTRTQRPPRAPQRPLRGLPSCQQEGDDPAQMRGKQLAAANRPASALNGVVEDAEVPPLGAAPAAAPVRNGVVHEPPPGAVRAPRLEVIERWCKGEVCSICVRACPEFCLAIGETEKVAVVRPERCTACRLCELLCPDFAIVVHDAWVPAIPFSPDRDRAFGQVPA